MSWVGVVNLRQDQVKLAACLRLDQLLSLALHALIAVAFHLFPRDVDRPSVAVEALHDLAVRVRNGLHLHYGRLLVPLVVPVRVALAPHRLASVVHC